MAKLSLSPQQEVMVIRKYAHYQTPQEISEYCKKNFKKPIVSTILIDRYLENEKFKPLFNRFRDEYLKKVSEVPLFNKRCRLDYLQKIFDENYSSGDLKEARQVLSQIREEAEGKGDVSFNFTSINHTEFHNMSNEELDAEYSKSLEQLKNLRQIKTKELGNVRIEDAQEVKEIEEANEAKNEGNGKV